MTRARLLLADDHRIIMEGLKSLLEPEFELVGMVEDGRALIEAARRLRPDVIVADISIPLLNGIEAVRQIIKDREDVKVVILTMHDDSAYAAAAIAAGATGYILKHEAASELIKAVRAVLQGKKYLSPLIAGELKQHSKEQSSQQKAENILTPRQCEVLHLLAEGHPLKEIATALNISTRTVEYHKYTMMESLGIKSSAELVRFAVRNRIVAEY
jgi:DNA-binding NarL/FixJ family response regulator